MLHISGCIIALTLTVVMAGPSGTVKVVLASNLTLLKLEYVFAETNYTSLKKTPR
jgi:hypothetical protein